jgi:membrane fusion protein, multidrug efflux system
MALHNAQAGRPSFILVFLIMATTLSVALSGCNRSPAKTDADSPSPTLQISAEDAVTLRSGLSTKGPSIIGSIQPERRADLRAEVAAVVLRLFHENGDTVKRGDVLVQLDDTAIRDVLASAEASGRTAELTLSQATRQLERQNTLRRSGMTTAQSLEDAEARRNNAQSEAEAAKSRIVTARQQLTRTVVRAPFDGVVSDRKVSAGDTAQVGKELLKVIDPSSLRFEGAVSADQIGVVKAGQSVSFHVNGYGDKLFSGKVRRVNPVANASTRQVEILVDFTGADQPQLAGLYAEGRVETESHATLMLPAASLVREGDRTFCWALRDGKLAKVAVVVGDRDERSGDYPLTSGLTEGDKVLRHPAGQLKDGQPVLEVAAKAIPAGN